VLLTVADVTRIAAEAVAGASPALQVAGVTLGGKDSVYVEILINIEGCHDGPCRLQVGAFRDVEAATLRHEIALKVREHQRTLERP